jgi:hypothetical protein
LRRRGLAPPHLRLPSLGKLAARAIRYRRVDLEDFIKTAIDHAPGARMKSIAELKGLTHET